MFERYTGRARRVIFFSRYEASQFGSTTIETEHLLLGLLRENNSLIAYLLPHGPAIETIREEIHKGVIIREKTSTSIDLPLTNECRRILAYAEEEAERLKHRQIGSEHLLLGIMREEKCLAATILYPYGLRLAEMREQLARSGAMDKRESESPHLFEFESAEARAMARLLLRLIRKRFGDVPEPLQNRVMHLPREKVEALADCLFDFTGVAELEPWLNANE